MKVFVVLCKTNKKPQEILGDLSSFADTALRQSLDALPAKGGAGRPKCGLDSVFFRLHVGALLGLCV